MCKGEVIWCTEVGGGGGLQGCDTHSTAQFFENLSTHLCNSRTQMPPEEVVCLTLGVVRNTEGAGVHSMYRRGVAPERPVGDHVARPCALCLLLEVSFVNQQWRRKSVCSWISVEYQSHCSPLQRTALLGRQTSAFLLFLRSHAP